MSKIYPVLAALTGGGTGALDKIDGAILSDGDAAQVVIDTGVYNYHLDATSGATENSPYVISPDLNAGTKRWILVTPQAPSSHIRVKQSSAQSIPDSTATTVVFDSEDEDFLSEYNTSTGEFTSTYAGRYLICAGVAIAAGWGIAEGIVMDVVVDGTSVRSSKESAAESNAFRLNPVLSFSMSLTANQVVRIDLFQNQGAAQVLISDGNYNFLTIDRIA